MLISAVQFAPEFFNKEFNIEYVKKCLSEIKSDIIVFPELSLSGYFFLNRDEASANAIDFESEELDFLREDAQDNNRMIIIGFAESKGNKIFNSAGLFFPDKTLNCVYRKTHLFYKEIYAFDRGDTGFFVVSFPDKDIRIGTMICYDWRFPEAARCLGLDGADLIACPSNLVTPLWNKVMPARAIENKVYLAVANRIGIEKRNDETLLFNGRSSIYDYNGDTLAEAPSDSAKIITAEIYPERTRDKSFNLINDINKDRLPDMYKQIMKKL